MRSALAPGGARWSAAWTGSAGWGGSITGQELLSPLPPQHSTDVPGDSAEPLVRPYAGLGGNALRNFSLWLLCSAYLCQCSLYLGQPEDHVHGAIHLNSRRQCGTGLLPLTCLGV